MDNIFPKEKINKLKALPKIKNKNVFEILGEEIKNAVNLIPSKKIYDFLKGEFNNKYTPSYQAFNQYLNEFLEKEKTLKTKRKKFILFANDKGGVGKTTLATLLNLPNSLILNLDKTREINDIYPYKKIVDFGKVEQEEGIELEDFLVILAEDDNFDNIIIDTKGGITEDLIKILPYVDSIIIPIKMGTTSEKPSYEFILQLKNYIEELNNKNVKWGIIYNEVSPKFLKKVRLGKYELADEYKNMEKILRNDVLGDALKAVTYFKRSEAITTREKEKEDIDSLMKKNFGAYLVVKKEIDRLNTELKKAI